MRQPAEHFHDGVNFAREEIIEFIDTHLCEGINLTAEDIRKEIIHWESQDKKIGLRHFMTGDKVNVQ